MRSVDTALISSLPTDTTPAEDHPRLSEAAAEAWIPRTCFKNGPPNQIGVELELMVVDTHRGHSAHYPQHRYTPLLAALADGGTDGRLTVEPGGQVELSSRPGPTLAHTVDVVQRDLTALRHRAGRSGIRLVGAGVDPFRSPRRIANHPRYTSMERYLDGWGPAGRLMMCSTASVQVNVEAGVHPPARGRTSTVQDQAARWELLHAIGPTLVAAFANSARSAGSSTGWKSSRQATWLRLDPARTGVPAARAAESFAETYTRWALDAPLMLVRREFGTWDAPAGVTFRDWLRQGRRIVPDRPAPTLDDLSYHMTTLFPQVRPKGYFEVRYLDAQPEDWWRVPTAVIAALLGDQATADRVRDACAPVEGRWRDAARIGLDDAELARSARVVLPLAANALAAEPVSAHLADEVAAYYERWTVRGRCPADDPPEKFQRAPGNEQHSANGEGTS